MKREKLIFPSRNALLLFVFLFFGAPLFVVYDLAFSSASKVTLDYQLRAFLLFAAS